MTIAILLLTLFAAVPSDPFPGLKTHYDPKIADHYLIKTAFGLVGWATIPSNSQEATVIEGLFFAGD